jgi:hypothetical protein
MRTLPEVQFRPKKFMKITSVHKKNYFLLTVLSEGSIFLFFCIQKGIIRSFLSHFKTVQSFRKVNPKSSQSELSSFFFDYRPKSNLRCQRFACTLRGQEEAKYLYRREIVFTLFWTFMLQFFRLCSKYQALQTWTSLSKSIDPANAVQAAVVHRSVSWLALKTP